MSRILVVGDVHGCRHLLEAVLHRAGYNPDRDRLILLGDYIDRGPDSKGTLELVRSLVNNGAVALRGNHEQMLLDAIRNPDPVNELGTWLNNGGRATLNSFGTYSVKLLARWRDFLESLPLIHQEEEYIFVHAGVFPGRELQTDIDLLWIRERFLFYPGAPVPGHVVVFGHTMTTIIPGHECARPWFAPGRIGIDTGAFKTGILTCLQLPCHYWQTG
ncbi:metallophosphoesterase [Desulfofundulus kuznetsovii DSM 6115]|uniref:Metallophosphoesterase n=1 Tax=Desulfofundulus kuznetsovii (strain DSM 6115 / VKM B-1805 / 17) TaxID=760568 RepID=A0AAU8P9K7_DESK7|nr:metallophosphoesterase [Desulfofundulus kuznetsovii DSM 6115]